MILQPRISRKKAQKGKIKPYLMAVRFGASQLDSIKLIACERGRISSKEIESARVRINRKLRSGQRGRYAYLGKIFPNVPITRKPNEVRMGQGKGSISHWIIRIKPNRVLFELPNKISEKVAKIRLFAASKKLSIKTIIK